MMANNTIRVDAHKWGEVTGGTISSRAYLNHDGVDYMILSVEPSLFDHAWNESR